MLFQFKQFTVDQSGCAMKINTDGVLLGAFVDTEQPDSILDIGTGTGVIALMLAQQFAEAHIDAIELDSSASATAARNFENSPFKNKPQLYNGSFQQYFEAYPDSKYDLIVSNPPFYINSLEASAKQMNLAKHAGAGFFEDLIKNVAQHLTDTGQCWLILPLPTAALVKDLLQQYGLNLQKVISIHSFADVEAHREILILSPLQTKKAGERFIIYKDIKVYSEEYRERLRGFFTIF
ncbi:tRNA1(Val) (adenine(37)-N6)-methyltransferase [Mucilaginibacter sp. AW1-3]